jgi:hypothetical protein
MEIVEAEAPHRDPWMAVAYECPMGRSGERSCTKACHDERPEPPAAGGADDVAGTVAVVSVKGNLYESDFAPCTL